MYLHVHFLCQNMETQKNACSGHSSLIQYTTLERKLSYKIDSEKRAMATSIQDVIITARKTFEEQKWVFCIIYTKTSFPLFSRDVYSSDSGLLNHKSGFVCTDYNYF